MTTSPRVGAGPRDQLGESVRCQELTTNAASAEVSSGLGERVRCSPIPRSSPTMRGPDVRRGGVDPDRDIVAPGRPGQSGEHLLDGVEPVGHSERARAHRHVGHPVHPEGAHLAVGRVRPREVPAPGVGDDAVGQHRAFVVAPVVGGVAHPDRTAFADRVGEQQQRSGVRRRRHPRRPARPGMAPGLLGDVCGLEQGVEAATERRGQHPAHLSGRALQGHSGQRHPPGPPQDDEAEQHGHRLVVSDHQRGHAVTGSEPVAAVAPADAAHGDAESDEVLDIAPHRALIDLEARGELGDRAGAAGLEELQEGEDARGRTGHADSLPIPGGFCPVSLLASDP